MSLAWNPNAGSKEREAQQLEQQLKHLEYIRRKYYQKLCTRQKYNTNTSADCAVKMDRAAFVLGRPINQWTEDKGVIGTNYSYRELKALYKMILQDGGLLYYTALLLTDPKRPDVHVTREHMSATHYKLHAQNYGLEEYRYRQWVEERTFEPVFLLVQRIKSDKKYTDFINNALTLVTPEDVNILDTGTTIYSAPKERVPLQAASLGSKRTPDGEANTPPVSKRPNNSGSSSGITSLFRSGQ